MKQYAFVLCILVPFIFDGCMPTNIEVMKYVLCYIYSTWTIIVKDLERHKRVGCENWNAHWLACFDRESDHKEISKELTSYSHDTMWYSSNWWLVIKHVSVGLEEVRKSLVTSRF